MIQRQLTVESALDILHELKTAEEIQLMLSLDKVRGIRSTYECPLANWIKKQTGVVVCVERTETRWVTSDSYGVRPHSMAMRFFVAYFDVGAYPELRPTFWSKLARFWRKS